MGKKEFLQLISLRDILIKLEVNPVKLGLSDNLLYCMFPDFFDKIHKKKKIIISNEKNDKIIIYLDSKTLDFIEVIGNIARTRQYTKDGFDLSILTPM